MNPFFGDAITSQTSAICGSVDALNRSVSHEGFKTRQALHQGFSKIDNTLNQGFAKLDEGLDRVDGRLQEGFEQIGRTLEQGFAHTIEELAILRSSFEELLAIARTPSHTAALEHFRVARDSYVRGLLPEAIEELDKAIGGVQGVSAGYKTEWRFHALRGLIYLGLGRAHDDPFVNPIRAIQSFELALRYLEPNDDERRSAFLCCAGRARMLLELESEDTAAWGLLLEAIRLNDHNVDAYLTLARLASRLGWLDEGTSHIHRACQLDGTLYALVEVDPCLAPYRAIMRTAREDEIRTLAPRTLSLIQELITDLERAETRTRVIETMHTIRVGDLPGVKKAQRRSTQTILLGVGAVAVSFAGCSAQLAGGSSLGWEVYATLDRFLPPDRLMILFFVGIAWSVIFWLARASSIRAAWQPATKRFQRELNEATMEAHAATGQALVSANAWLCATRRLADIGVDDPAMRERGANACSRLHLLATGAAA